MKVKGNSNMATSGGETYNTNSTELDIHSLEFTTDYWYDLYYHEQIQRDKTTHASPLEVLSSVLSILGLIANVLSVFVIKRIHKKMSIHFKLIVNLCFSDCLILASSIFKHIISITHIVDICFNVATRLLTDMALIATLLNLLAIAVDHYLAILKPFLYKKEMTNFRGICTVVNILIISILTISVEIVMGAIHKQEIESLCEAIAYDKTNSEFGIVIFIFVVLCVIIVIYARIYLCVVRNKRTYSNMRHRQKDSSNIRTLVTTSIFVLTFVLCWSPIGIFNAYMYNEDEEYIIDNLEDLVMTGEILYSILLLNAIADPIIYTFRLPQVKRRCFTFNTNVRRQSSKMITLTSEI